MMMFGEGGNNKLSSAFFAFEKNLDENEKKQVVFELHTHDLLSPVESSEGFLTTSSNRLREGFVLRKEDGNIVSAQTFIADV